MSLPRELPSMFGRFTAILQDHEHLGTTLRRLRAMCAALEAVEATSASELAPQSLLAELRADLAAHFGAEESAEYFGVVVGEEPQLEPQIDGLKGEHTAMLHAVENLCRLADDRERWLLLAASTRELVAELERHERAESRLLRTLFFPKA